MKEHLTDGELRASLDGELDERLLHHLDTCVECQSHLHQLKQAHLRTTNRLGFLAPRTEPVSPVQSAWIRFTGQYLKQKETSMLRKWFAFPVVRIGAIAVLALALLMAFPTTRALAGELLNLFRVQQVVVLPIDSTGLENMTGNEVFGSQLSQLISSSTIVTDELGDPLLVASAEEASEAAGFNVRLPKEIIPSRISVIDSAAFTIRMDRTKAQAFLDSAGRSDLVLPEESDGAEISISIPSSVRMAFGTCPEPQTPESEMDTPGSMENLYPDCVVFSQLPSPVVNAPNNLDIEQLAQIGLEFTGMSREEAETFTSSVDWTTTLVVPIPRNSTTYADVSVDGVIGKFIQRDTHDLPNYMLLWVKDGTVYFISGSGTDTFRAFEIANALP